MLKLTKSEWEYTEMPIPAEEKNILRLIAEGYENTNIVKPSVHTHTLMDWLKVDKSADIVDFLFSHYFGNDADTILQTYPSLQFTKPKGKTLIKLKSGDKIRLNKILQTQQTTVGQAQTQETSHVLEFVLWKQLMEMYRARQQQNDKWMNHHYTLSFLLLNCVDASAERILNDVVSLCRELVQHLQPWVDTAYLIYNAVEVIERNDLLWKYNDVKLFSHQKELFDLFALTKTNITKRKTRQEREKTRHEREKERDKLTRNEKIREKQLAAARQQDEEQEEQEDDDAFSSLPCSSSSSSSSFSSSSSSHLVFYTAPTGCGKTLSPLGLAQKSPLIFLCAARHVALTFARNCIAMELKIAFAFGAKTAEDVRLHFFAAKEYTRDRRSGGIGKVDNSFGENVQVMVCDVPSYLVAMRYMIAFHSREDIVLYWDEPNIGLDVLAENATPEEQTLQQMIQRNWRENEISHVVLSSATLCKPDEIESVVQGFATTTGKGRGIGESNCIVRVISNDECRKSIPIVDNNGRIAMPHTLFPLLSNLHASARQCIENPTLLRYFDLQETINVLTLFSIDSLCVGSLCVGSLDTNSLMTMKQIKLMYCHCLLSIATQNELDELIPIFQNKNIQRVPFNHTVTKDGKRIKSKTTPLASFSSSTTSSSGALKRMETMDPYSLSSSTSLSSSLSFASHFSSLNRSQSPSVNSDKTSAMSGTSGMYMTTMDAWTLTNGPTMYITTELEKIARFCIQQSNIPEVVMRDIETKIQQNNERSERIEQLEAELQLQESKLASKLAGSTTEESSSKKDAKKKQKLASKLVSSSQDKTLVKLQDEIRALKMQHQPIQLHDLFVPNKPDHLAMWAPPAGSSLVEQMQQQGQHGQQGQQAQQVPFTSNIPEEIAVRIMKLPGVNMIWKILLLLGIGVYTYFESKEYMDIMKQLTANQQLYLVIVDKNFMFGTNDQLCHGYIGKDLQGKLSHQMLIQAMGRIGRGNIQQDYTIRLRDNSHAKLLFLNTAIVNNEAINMIQLMTPAMLF